MTEQTNNKAIIIPVVVGVVALAVGYILGALIGFGGGNGSNSKYVGTYTNTSWNGGSASLVLNSDGTCKLPSQYDRSCTYEIKDGYVYFNGQETSTTAIGETGLVYADHNFTKLK